jgi:transposase InsO family protein
MSPSTSLLKNIEFDVQTIVQRALEKYPGRVKPRLITDNGSLYISKEFAEYLKHVGLQHFRTSMAYPQSNGKIKRYHRTINEECLQQSSLVNLEG